MSVDNHPKVPTLRAVDHCAYTVPDLDEAVQFFVDHFGAELVFYDGPFVDDESDGMRRRLNVDPRARTKIAMIRVGKHHNVELFEYAAPDQRAVLPRNSDIGGHHIALYVDDLDLAIAHLVEHGVTVLGAPTASKGPHEGQRWVYFLAPWGMQFELVCYPDGKAWDREQLEEDPSS